MSAARTEGVARLGKRTKDLTKRLRPGEIAIIDHEDIDRVAAEALVEREPAAVLNVAASTSGRYPNAGPRILVDAGIVLVDSLGDEVFEGIRDGERITVEDGRVLLEGQPIAEGTRQDDASVTASQEASREGLSEQLELFAENTMEYMLRERDLLLDGIGAPEVATRMDGRPVLIVVRGYHYKEDLATLKPFLREKRPDMIIGDMDSVSDRALRSGSELVVHAYRDGRAPGMERLAELGLAEGAVSFPASGTSEDIAMLLADEKGASVIVAVGTHGTLEE
ncbi:MAG: putative cytokinetic ring protein SteA, partial [Brachybacterium sp.]|uniref:putative cytokinetic ring protein SteA n=1 Tax=Brachybacterium sp. TaxID=1891286 RepID=UPI00324289FD